MHVWWKVEVCKCHAESDEEENPYVLSVVPNKWVLKQEKLSIICVSKAHIISEKSDFTYLSEYIFKPMAYCPNQ